MIKARNYRRNRNFLSLLGMIAFLLFATQINYQYASSADPSADSNDPVSIAARICYTVRGTMGEHLPVAVETPVLVAVPTPCHIVTGLPGRHLMPADRTWPSLRGPPAI